MGPAFASLLLGAFTLASQPNAPLVDNPTFDDGSLNGWVANAWAYNGRLTDAVSHLSDLGLVAAGPPTYASGAYTGAPQWALPSGMLQMSTELPPKYPFDGTGCAGINLNNQSGAATTLSTTFTISANHFSSSDGRLRVRLRALPTFVNNEKNLSGRYEAFIYVAVDNITRGTNDIASYYAGQSAFSPNTGIWYQGQTGQGTQMVSRRWSEISLAVAMRDVDEGDQLRFTALASGCAAGNGQSSAQLYIDSVEAHPTQPMLTARVPRYVPAAGTYAITFDVDHGDLGHNGNVFLRALHPVNITRIVQLSSSAPWTCQVTADQFNCSASGLTPAGQSNVTIRYKATATENASVPLVTYALDRYKAGGNPAVDMVRQAGTEQATTTLANRNLTNLLVTSGIDVQNMQDGDGSAVLTVTNQGPTPVNGATFTDIASSALSGRTYSCTTTSNAQVDGKTTAAGTGNFSLSLVMPISSTVRCTVRLPADAAAPTTMLRYGGVVDLPAGVTDLNPLDNESAIVFALADIAADAAAAAGTPRVTGIACTTGAQCATGFCADGVCCQTACTGACEACNEQNAEGVCTPISGDARPGHEGCGPYACQAGHCLGGCQADTDCVSLYSCAQQQNAKACVPNPNACVHDADCPAGRFCTPAFTCESPATQDKAAPHWLLGGGCRSGTDGALALALAWPLAVLQGVRRARRGKAARRSPRARRALLPLVCLFFVAALHTEARAKSTLAMPLERLQLLGGRNDLFNLASPRIAHQTITGHAMADVQYLHQPLRLESATNARAQTALVPYMGVLELGGGMMLSHGVELDAVVPLVVHGNHAAPFFDAALRSGATTFGVGDLRLTPKWAPLAWRHLQLGVAVPVAILASHHRPFLSTDGVSVAPRLLVEARFPAHIDVLLNAGYLIRPRREVLGTIVQDAVQAALAASWVLPKQARAFTFMLGSWAEIPVGGHLHGRVLIEGLVGLRARLVDQWSIEAMYGGPLTHAPGVPRARAMLAVRFAERSKHRLPAPDVVPPAATPEVPSEASVPVPAASLEGPPYTPPAPQVPEPNADLDVPLVAPAAPAPPTSIPFLTPPPPKDAPAIEEDALPLLLPAVKKAPPRPHQDRDKDGIYDGDDHCPDVPGHKGGPSAGCPSTLLLANAALNKRPIPYVIIGKYAAFDATAEQVMEEVRQIVTAYPQMNLRIIGHVPAIRGIPIPQREHLSMRRAEDVAHWLSLRGIDKGRIRLEGRGSREAPDTSETPAALTKCRRVEVRLEPPDDAP